MAQNRTWTKNVHELEEQKGVAPKYYKDFSPVWKVESKQASREAELFEEEGKQTDWQDRDLKVGRWKEVVLSVNTWEIGNEAEDSMEGMLIREPSSVPSCDDSVMSGQ